jgi:hypothetical protein
VKRWLFVIVLAGAICGASAGQEAVGQTDNAGGGHSIQFQEGDPLWQPTAAQFQGWVNAGINAAAAEQELYSISGVSRWGTESIAGLPCGAGLLHYAVVVTPELLGNVSGWGVAWDEAMWQSILADQQTVVAQVGQVLYQLHSPGELTILLAIRRSDVYAPLDINSAVYYQGEWREVILSSGSSAWSYQDADPLAGNPTSDWAESLALAWAMYSPSLADPGSVQIVEGRLPSSPTGGPEEALTSQAQIPPAGTTFRFVFGKPEELATIDF